LNCFIVLILINAFGVVQIVLRKRQFMSSHEGMTILVKVSNIKSITNDLRKNIAIITKKLTVVRLVTHDNTSMCNVRSFQDLAKMAYYVILDGEVVKDKLPIKKLNVNEYSNENVKIEINKLNFEHERYQLLIK